MDTEIHPIRDSSSESEVSSRFRYPGTRSFTSRDKNLFCGRGAEADLLFHTITQKRLTILSGASGVGKTSLLQAAIYPRLEGRGNVVLTCRVGRPFIETGRSNNPAVDLLTARFEEECGRLECELRDGDRSSFWAYLKTMSIWKDGELLDPVFVFDQFEEIFTLQSAPIRRSIMAELAPVIRKVPTDQILGMLDQEPPPFSDTPPSAKMVFGIREEFIGQLKGFGDRIPEIFDNVFVLQPLTYEQAKEAVTIPALDPGDFETPSFKWAEEELDRMLKFLSTEKLDSEKTLKSGVFGEGGGGEWKEYARVEPFPLQILCSNVEMQMKEISKNYDEVSKLLVPSSFLEDDEGMNELLRSHYEGEIAKVQPHSVAEKVQMLLDDGLLTQEGRRTALPEDIIVKKYDVKPKTLRFLCERRLLRRDLIKGTNFYEISHDRLVQPILDKRRWRIPENMKRVLIWGSLGAVFVMLLVIVFGLLATVDAAKSEKLLSQEVRRNAENLQKTTRDSVTQARGALERAEEENQKLALELSDLKEESASLHAQLLDREATLNQLRIQNENLVRKIGSDAISDGVIRSRIESFRVETDALKRVTEGATERSAFRELLQSQLRQLAEANVLLKDAEKDFENESKRAVLERGRAILSIYQELSEASRQASLDEVRKTVQNGMAVNSAIKVSGLLEAAMHELEIPFRVEIAENLWWIGDTKAYEEWSGEIVQKVADHKNVDPIALAKIGLRHFRLNIPNEIAGRTTTLNDLDELIELRFPKGAPKRASVLLLRNRVILYPCRKNLVDTGFREMNLSQRDLGTLSAAVRELEELSSNLSERERIESRLDGYLAMGASDGEKVAEAFSQIQLLSQNVLSLNEGTVSERLLAAEILGWKGLMAADAETRLTALRSAKAILDKLDQKGALPFAANGCRELISRLAETWIGPDGRQFHLLPGYSGVYLSNQELRISEYRTFVDETGHESSKCNLFGVRSDRSWGYTGQKVSWFEIAEEYNLGEEGPVSGVSFSDAVAYCEWLTQRERNAKRIGQNDSYRLPRDSEWEVAARAGAKSSPLYPWDGPLSAGLPVDENGIANMGGAELLGEGGDERKVNYPEVTLAFLRSYRDEFVFPSPVGSFEENALGFFDMDGNMREITMGDTSNKPLLRGGSWIDSDPESLRLDRPHERNGSSDNIQAEDGAWSFVGFRIAFVKGQ